MSTEIVEKSSPLNIVVDDASTFTIVVDAESPVAMSTELASGLSFIATSVSVINMEEV